MKTQATSATRSGMIPSSHVTRMGEQPLFEAQDNPCTKPHYLTW